MVAAQGKPVSVHQVVSGRVNSFPTELTEPVELTPTVIPSIRSRDIADPPVQRTLQSPSIGVARSVEVIVVSVPSCSQRNTGKA